MARPTRNEDRASLFGEEVLAEVARQGLQEEVGAIPPIPRPRL